MPGHHTRKKRNAKEHSEEKQKQIKQSHKNKLQEPSKECFKPFQSENLVINPEHENKCENATKKERP